MEAANGCRLEGSHRMMEDMENHDDELAEIDLTEQEIDAMMAAGEPVEITAPPGMSHLMRFELYATGPRQYRWRLVRDSGEILATSEVYASKKEARRAVDEVMRARLVDRTAVGT
jgi:uncharacterized protein YegP (UPF0339 family)